MVQAKWLACGAATWGHMGWQACRLALKVAEGSSEHGSLRRPVASCAQAGCSSTMSSACQHTKQGKHL